MSLPLRIVLALAAVLAALTAIRRAEPAQVLPLVEADYQNCATVRPGPIQRPDGYTTRPYARKRDVA